MAKRIVFLPIWGKVNQTIPLKQMEAIRNQGGEAMYGLPGTFFPMTRSSARLRPDIISMDWIHQYCLASGLFKSIFKTAAFLIDIAITRWVFGVKLVWTVHNLQHHDPRPRKIERWISSVFARSCVKVRLLGDGVSDIVCKRFDIKPENLVILPEGSFSGYYPDFVSPVEARSKLELPSESTVWLYFGALRPYKGVEVLISWFKENQPPNTILVVAGNPFSAAYSQELLASAANFPSIRIFAETIPDEDLQFFFRACDLVVLPFKNVFNSSSVVLAMSFGKPVVAPEIGLVAFRLQYQKRLLFNPDQGLGSVLQTAAQLSTGELQQLGSKNYEFVNRFHWSEFATFVLNL